MVSQILLAMPLLDPELLVHHHRKAVLSSLVVHFQVQVPFSFEAFYPSTHLDLPFLHQVHLGVLNGLIVVGLVPQPKQPSTPAGHLTLVHMALRVLA